MVYAEFCLQYIGGNVFQYVKSDRDPINPLDSAEIYRIEYRDKNRDKGYYIGITKWKINERIKEDQGDIKNAKNNTASKTGPKWKY